MAWGRNSNMKRWAWAASLFVAAFGLMISIASHADALSVQNPYHYKDDSHQTIVDGGGNEYTFGATGCGFETDPATGRTSSIITRSQPYDPARIFIPESDYCLDSSGNARPADAYWRHSDGTILVISGQTAAQQNKPADAGIIGGADVVNFDSNGLATGFSSVSVEGPTNGTSATSNQIEFDGICRQEAGTFSWLVCPMINFANRFVERLVGYVLDLLETEPLLLNTQRGKGLYSAWSQFRTIANILLIPLFLASIYAMLFSANNRYTVTRILPRLVVAALAMQLSFFFAAIIIDIGNVLAAGIAGIFNLVNVPIKEALAQGGYNLSETLGGTALDRGVGAVVGTGLAVALGWLFVAGATPPGIIVITAFVAGIVLTFLALALRQLAIVVFVVLAPLAMVMGVLPNTERWMREWFDNLIKLVLIYPLVTLLFGVASTLSLLALHTGSTSEVNQMVASLLPVVVLISVPLLFKLAGTLFRNVTTALSGVSSRAKGGIVGDIRDPGSLAFRSRLGKLGRRYQSTMEMAKRPGLGWTGQFTQPIRKERDYYRLGGESVADIFGAAFPSKLKRLVYGERPFKGRLGVEDYTYKDLMETSWAKRDIMRIRNTPGEMTSVMMGPAVEHAAANFDRGLNMVYGLASMAQDGAITPDIATEALLGFQARTRGIQRWTSFIKPEDLTNPNVRSPRDLYNTVFGDYRYLSAADQQRNLEAKRQAIVTSSGTLMDQQGEGSWKVVADALHDDRIITQARTNEDTYRAIKDLVFKAEALSSRVQRSGTTERELDAIVAQAEAAGEGENPVAGFYGKSGVEIRAMLEFIQRAREAKQQLGIDLGQVIDPGEI